MLTTVKIYAADECDMWDCWEQEYEPYNYILKTIPYEQNGIHVMIVCKDLLYKYEPPVDGPI